MAVKVQVNFIAKTTIRIHCEITDDDDVSVTPDPTSVKVTINDPSPAVVIDDVAMSKASDGVFDYYYRTTAATVKGWWTGLVIVIDGIGASAKTSIDDFGFRIK